MLARLFSRGRRLWVLQTSCLADLEQHEDGPYHVAETEIEGLRANGSNRAYTWHVRLKGTCQHAKVRELLLFRRQQRFDSLSTVVTLGAYRSLFSHSSPRRFFKHRRIQPGNHRKS